MLARGKPRDAMHPARHVSEECARKLARTAAHRSMRKQHPNDGMVHLHIIDFADKDKYDNEKTTKRKRRCTLAHSEKRKKKEGKT